METILDRIVAAKRQEVARAKERTPETELAKRIVTAPPTRDFRAALLRDPSIGVIGEIKKASPSAGVLRGDFDPLALAREYESAGADCLSILTDGPFFQGSLDHLSAVRAVTKLPILRKDFIIDQYQVLESRLAGADAVLLIAEILDDIQLLLLLAGIHALRMQALVEIYDPSNLDRVLKLDATLIGINNRDLRTFQTSLDHTLTLAPRVPAEKCLISESGIRSADDIQRLKAAGVKGVLIGETFMRSGDIAATLHSLRNG